MRRYNLLSSSYRSAYDTLRTYRQEVEKEKEQEWLKKVQETSLDTVIVLAGTILFILFIILIVTI